MNLLDTKKLVIKVGSTLLVDAAQNRLNKAWLTSLIDDIAMLHQRGTQVVVVSSGSIALGKTILKTTQKQLSLEKQQAAAAIGQIQLAHTYQALLQEHNIHAAQVLITIGDSESRGRFLNARNTLDTLLRMGAVPIVNENDTVATSEIRYGDNDRLAARVAQMIGADTLVLLSDIDGLYTADPNKNPNAEFIPVVNELTDDILKMAQESSSNFGSGGMITKLQAAKIVLNSGCNMLITKGSAEHPLNTFIQEQKGTWFVANTNPLSAKKAWLSEHQQPQGTLTIDDGAHQALNAGKSLLPVGITHIAGRFTKGDVVRICNTNNDTLAFGLSNYSHDDLQKIQGQPSTHIASLLGYEASHEAIHRDNLVCLI